MTAYRFVTLTCDRCGEIFDDGINVKVAETRAAAARHGWRYERRRDLCPHCKTVGLKWPNRPDGSER